LNGLTFELDFVRVCIMTVARLVMKVKVIGQGQGLGLSIAAIGGHYIAILQLVLERHSKE